MQNLPAKFEEYLKEELQVSGKTLRNYRADLSHFLGWATLHLGSRGINIQSTDSIIPHFTSFMVANYKGYHLENKIPESTTNRRLSTLRNFGRFLTKIDLIPQNPTELVTNIKKTISQEEKINAIIQDFKKDLMVEGVSNISIKNYISDIKQFLAWIPKTQTLITKL